MQTAVIVYEFVRFYFHDKSPIGSLAQTSSSVNKMKGVKRKKFNLGNVISELWLFTLSKYYDILKIQNKNIYLFENSVKIPYASETAFSGNGGYGFVAVFQKTAG